MHRDVKSDNIFYCKENNNIILILGDFGESKIIDKHNKAKTCAGTNVWMAPEVLGKMSFVMLIICGSCSCYILYININF